MNTMRTLQYGMYCVLCPSLCLKHHTRTVLLPLSSDIPEKRREENGETDDTDTNSIADLFPYRFHSLLFSSLLRHSFPFPPSLLISCPLFPSSLPLISSLSISPSTESVVLSNTIISYLILSCPILSYPILSHLILSHPSYPMPCHPILSYPIPSILSHAIPSHPIPYLISSHLIRSHREEKRRKMTNKV